jgi:hypothetical protein
MSNEKQTPMAVETVDQLVLVQDPILGSKYELQSVEVYVEGTIKSLENGEQE